MITNVLIAHNEDIENMLKDLKSIIKRCNEKIGKQQIQYHDELKTGHISYSLTKIEVAEWTWYLLKELKEKL